MPGAPPRSQDSFDPYYQWLGIPAKDQPADHYRLLGIEQFESNEGVINNAADRQMAHLRTFAAGKRGSLATRLLNEISAARVCLLDERQREDYDSRLRREAVSLDDGDLAMPQLPPPLPALASEQVWEQPVSVAHRPPRSKRSRAHPARAWLIFTVSGLMLCVVCFLALFYQRDAARTDAARAAEGEGHRAAAVAGRREVVPRASASSNGGRPHRPRLPKERPDEARADAAPAVDGTSVAVQEPRRSDLPPLFHEQPSSPDLPSSTRPSASNPEGTPSQQVPVDPPPATPPPAPPSDPFAGLPRFVPLPGITETGRFVLASLEPLDGPLRIELMDSFAGAQFVVTPIAGAPEPQWRVSVRPDKETGELEPVCELFLASHKTLGFRWSDAVDEEHAAQLSNCLLRLSQGEHASRLALRPPQSAEPLTLDMSKRRVLQAFTLENPPPLDKLFVEVTALEGFPQAAGFRESTQLAPLGKLVIVEFADSPGAQIRIKLARHVAGRLAVSVEPVFEEGDRESLPMTLDRLDDTVNAAKKMIARLKGELDVRNGEVARLQQQDAALKKERVGARSPQRRAITGRIKTETELIQELQRGVAIQQARLRAEPKLRKLLNTLHQAQVAYRIYAAERSRPMAEVELVNAAIR